MQRYDDLLGAKHLKVRELTPPLADGGSFTLHRTNTATSTSPQMTKGSRRGLFCFSGEPKRYVPCFFSSSKSRGRREQALSATRSSPSTSTGCAGVRGTCCSSSAISTCSRPRELTAVDGDRIDDLVLLDERWNDSRRPLRVCLFTPGAEQCRLLEVDTRLEPPEPQMTQPELAIDQGRITTRLVRPEGGAPLATAEYQVRGGALQRIGAR